MVGEHLSNSPGLTDFPDAKVELLEVANSVLLILPVGSFLLLGTQPAPEAISQLLQEPVICLREAEPMVVIHSVDFVLRQGTSKCVYCQSARENPRDPGDREGLSSSLPG
jgi:hypothetical protein